MVEAEAIIEESNYVVIFRFIGHLNLVAIANALVCCVDDDDTGEEVKLCCKIPRNSQRQNQQFMVTGS
jgi:hypothetical protein